VKKQRENPSVKKGCKGKVVQEVFIWRWFGHILCKLITLGTQSLIKNTSNSLLE